MSLIQKIKEHSLIPLFYHNDLTICKKVLDAVINCGLPILEFTNRGPKAIDNFKQLVMHLGNNTGSTLGVGSVKTDEEARIFIDLGASLIVSPFLDKSIAKVCVKNNIPWIPGCGTLTEMITAEKLGAEIVKLFPGGVFGPKFISSVLAPCPWLKIMPTGGVTADLENISQWFNAGTYCLGMGSKLISKEYLEENNFDGLEKHILQVIENIKIAKKDG
ncbi:MAG TPA: bifunctional 4-hydroxy-2-oxoglutarate aldolase/2-dehydro-3-deoxy-phosphogluconate aldolase [Candidatus Marinimicrobia bacterium]|jgi:2-dehydro-3-deoxyphosphogluconate aldolase/(4S)-4-hydroxy-2-oxoglutarate aldolase|nr:bifunctional 4-hydroxy-2-oxoglutarate aldolase/2-dehydro-3-deoxy-phosphogluconate aldolase [Candidatus Neomarinimicrobiota bacterium]